MEVYEPTIVLLLIRNGVCAANDYGIMRCLERRFGWLHWGEIKQHLLANGHVLQLDHSPVPSYAITATGEAFSTQFREQALAKVQQDPFTYTDHTRWLIAQL